MKIISKCADGYGDSISVYGNVKKTAINLRCPVTKVKPETTTRQFLSSLDHELKGISKGPKPGETPREP